MACEIKTCTKHDARQSVSGRITRTQTDCAARQHFDFTKSAPVIFVGARERTAAKTTEEKKS
jgi:hypothetical protein